MSKMNLVTMADWEHAGYFTEHQIGGESNEE